MVGVGFQKKHEWNARQAQAVTCGYDDQVFDAGEAKLLDLWHLIPLPAGKQRCGGHDGDDGRQTAQIQAMSLIPEDKRHHEHDAHGHDDGKGRQSQRHIHLFSVDPPLDGRIYRSPHAEHGTDSVRRMEIRQLHSRTSERRVHISLCYFYYVRHWLICLPFFIIVTNVFMVVWFMPE